MARFAVREVIPIHMPTQQRAMRLPAVASAAARAARTVVTSHSSLLPVAKAKPPAATMFVDVVDEITTDPLELVVVLAAIVAPA